MRGKDKSPLAESSSTKLYAPNLLFLATRLAEFPLERAFGYTAEARSRACGSVIELGVDLGSDGRVAKIGMQVSACAIGQSSAAILALGAKGRLPSEIDAAKNAIEAWLGAESEDDELMPDWPEFAALKPAIDHKARHGALLLAWTAITQALSSSVSAR